MSSDMKQLIQLSNLLVRIQECINKPIFNITINNSQKLLIFARSIKQTKFDY